MNDEMGDRQVKGPDQHETRSVRGIFKAPVRPSYCLKITFALTAMFSTSSTTPTETSVGEKGGAGGGKGSVLGW